MSDREMRESEGEDFRLKVSFRTLVSILRTKTT